MTIYYLVSIGRSLRDANNELRMMLEYVREWHFRRSLFTVTGSGGERERGGGE